MQLVCFFPLTFPFPFLSTFLLLFFFFFLKTSKIGEKMREEEEMESSDEEDNGGFLNESEIIGYHSRKRQTKEERLETVKAGREGRGKFGSTKGNHMVCFDINLFYFFIYFLLLLVINLVSDSSFFFFFF